ncbi:Aspartic proteinase CDR1-like [Quillaja saponaria]|uniref:Aspartic proteinase CDR1-like n=1 Tax=Quillaja saponaria TaxID=32244 RepID=A0AAD7PHH5_QUISA|nr:Aspartic proteinase CDR1-like [Quillaja saponaria]
MAMAALSASHIKPLGLFFFTLVAFAPFPTTTSTNPRKTIITKLIHPNSVFSPYHNPKVTTTSSSLNNASTHSLKSSLASKARGIPYVPNDIRAGIIAEATGTQFMVNISIGDPPKPQLLTMDTGSNLFWIQCLPCIKCFEQKYPIFDPSNSSTYTNLPCTSPSCTVSSRDKCDPSYNCKFSFKYLDGTAVSGIMGTERLKFETSDEGIISVSNVVFGCAHDNDGYSGETSGILGLGPSSISLVTQIGFKFSYCIGNIKDPKYSHNNLILGDGAKLEGDSTPLEVFNELYYLTLEGISVGEKRLEIDPNIFKREASGKGGVVIDSGTTVSFLAEAGYVPLSNEVQSLLNGKLERVQDPANPALCYKGIIDRDLTGFPVVTFHFAGGAELALDINSMFEENGEDEFCMAIHQSGLDELSVIGIMAQQSYNIGYDLGGNKIFFQRIDCELLELAS